MQSASTKRGQCHSLSLFVLSDDRSPEVFRSMLEAATEMQAVLTAASKPNCLIIDEIDGAPLVSDWTMVVT